MRTRIEWPLVKYFRTNDLSETILILIMFSLYFRRTLPFNKTLHLYNSWNENKPVKIGRDGQVNEETVHKNIPKEKMYKIFQEIEPRCAEALCRLFPSDPSIDISEIALKAKKNKKTDSYRSRSPVSAKISGSTRDRSPESAKRQHRSPPISKYRSSDDMPSSRHRHSYPHRQSRSPTNSYRHRSDVTLYFIIIRLTHLAIAFSTNRNQYRTCKTGLG